MTENGTFIINGAERVVVSQLVRSPRVYYGKEVHASGKVLYNASIIPNRGAWLEFEMDTNDVVYVRIDRTRKLPVTVLLRAIGYGTNAQLIELFNDAPALGPTLDKDSTQSEGEGLIEIYKRLRPGEPPTEESARSLFETLFYDPKRYDLAAVGRYKMNKKLRITERLVGRTLSRPVVHPETGEILAEASTRVDRRLAERLHEAGVNVAYVRGKDDEEIKIIGNSQPAHDAGPYQGRYCRHGGVFLQSQAGVGTVDDIDHLGNRRLKAVGELLQNQFRIGLSRMERVVRERMTIKMGYYYAPGTHQHPAAGCSHQGVLRQQSAVPIHGPNQSAVGADPQAAAFGPLVPAASAVRGLVSKFETCIIPTTGACVPLKPLRTQHRLIGSLCTYADQRVRIHRNAVPPGEERPGYRRGCLFDSR